MNEQAHVNSSAARTGVLTVAAGAGLAAALLLLWQLATVLLLVFGAVLFAVLLDGLARALHVHARIPHAAGVCLVVVIGVALLIALGWLGEPQVADQLGALRERAFGGLQALQQVLGQSHWGRALLHEADWSSQFAASPGAWFQRVSGLFSGTLGTLANLGLVLVIGFYFALQPGVYTAGIVRLVPRGHRERARELLRAQGRALRWWLIGRIISMSAIGVLTAVALGTIGVPLALGLGFVAGVLSFVPFIGPIASAVPAVLVALLQGPWQVVYVLVIYVGVQFIEGNVITPLTQERVMAMPPAVLLLSQVLLGSLFGILGLILATPLAVVVIVGVQMLYIEDTLGDRVHVLGD